MPVKDLIIRGGENVASTTVENALCEDDRVIEAAAVPIPCPHLGERVAAVVYAPGASEISLLKGIKPKYVPDSHITDPQVTLLRLAVNHHHPVRAS
jgi:non-ribosomal peptide synthetase component E (peptide arylation enzyme)